MLVLCAKAVVALFAIVLVRNALPQLSHATAVRAVWLVLAPLAVSGVLIVESFR